MRVALAMKSLVVVGLSVTLGLLEGGCSKASSTTPDPPPTPTRIIRLGGNLNFGNVSLANSPSVDGVLTVSNDGNDTLQVTGISGGRCTGTYLTAIGSTSFAVAAGGTVPVTLRFAPRVRLDCSGIVTVFGNQTSGTDTIPLVARGVLPGCETVPDPLPPPCVP